MMRYAEVFGKARKIILLSAWVCLAQSARADTTPLPLTHVIFSPTSPQVGQVVNVYVTLETTLSGPDWVQVFPTAQLDSATAVNLTQSSETLWTAQLVPLTQAGSHQLSVSVNMQNGNEADTLRRAIGNLNQQIADLEDQIAATTDPTQKASLQAQLQADQTQLQGLENALSNTSRVIGVDSFSFSVSSGSSAFNSGLPLSH